MQKAAFPGRTQMKTGMEGTLNNEAEKRGYRKCCSTATAFGVPCGRAVGDSWSGRSIEIPEIRRAGNSLLCSINRPISAYFPGGARLRASETILVSRLDNRPRHRRCGPVGRERRNISKTC